MLVVDSSALIAAFAGDVRIPALDRRLADDGDLHAPHVVDVETLHALRRLVRTGELSPGRAASARRLLADVVALSEILAAPLVTVDGRLARSSGHRADVELYVP